MRGESPGSVTPEEALAKVAAFVEAGKNPPHWEESGADEWDEWRRLRSEAEGGLALLEQTVAAYASLTRSIRPGEISITPVYGAIHHEAFVQLVWGREAGQWAPEEARAHAFRILQVAEGAVGDAFLTEFLAEEAKLGHVQIAGVVSAYREWRAKKRM